MLTRRTLLSAPLLAAVPAAAAPTASKASPWDLKALAKAPDLELKSPTPFTANGVDCDLHEVYYQGEPWQGRPTRVFGYLARPARARDRQLPGVVLVHGGGGTAFPEWARMWAGRGYVALAMDLAGCGPGRRRLEDGGPDQSDEWKFHRVGGNLKDTWPYQAVASVIRGISLVAAQKVVDPKRIGITGISWGGYLTSIVMSLDIRLRAAVPVYGCGFLHQNSVWVPTFQKLSDADRTNWIERFDPSAYLAQCKTPVLWMNGTNDFAYPLDSYQKSYREVRGPRTLCITVKMPHSHEAGWARPEIEAFLDSHLKSGRGGLDPAGLGAVTPMAVRGNEVRAFHTGPSSVTQASIHWTTELEKPWQERQWQTTFGEVLDLHNVRAELPSTRPLVAFLTLRDRRDFIISTEHEELRPA